MGEIKGHVKLGLCMRYPSGDTEWIVDTRFRN